mgnify:FL=1
METFDYGIIGSGPAGYTTALYLVTQGKSVVLFEKDEVGGTCLNRGCIPTKILLHVAELYQSFKTADKFGIYAENITFDYEKVAEHKNKIVEKLRKSLEFAMKKSGIKVVKETAKVVSDNLINASGEEYSCSKIVVATGSKPRELKGLEFDHKFILSSDDILNLTKLPEKMVIVGSGAIGIEFARILSAFGVEITLVELASRLVPLADWEVSKRVERQFKMKKIKFYTETSIKSIENKVVTLSNDEKIEPDCILVATGRVCVDDNKYEQNNVSIIGDASAEIQLAHYAVSQAKKLVFDISFDKDLIPSVIYGSPEIAWVGEVEKQDADTEFKKVVFPISALGKAHADDSIDGFIKILAKDNKIVGASIISNEASALIQQITIAIQNNISIDKLKEVCFAHPTYSEGIMEGIMQL